MTIAIAKVDLIALIVMVIFGIRGYKKGALGALIRLMGLVASFVLAWYVAPVITKGLMNIPLIQSLIIKLFGGFEMSQAALLVTSEKIVGIAMIVLMFILVYLLLNRISNKLFELTAVKIISILDRILGMILGFAIGGLFVLLVGVVVYYVAKYTNNTDLMLQLSGSVVRSLVDFVVSL